MKKLIFTLCIAVFCSAAIAQNMTTTVDPLVGATNTNKGDMLVTKTWKPVYHTVSGKKATIGAKDFSRFLASGGFDGTMNDVNAMGIWMYDSATNKLTIRRGEVTTVWDLKEVSEKGFTIKNALEEMRFVVAPAK